MLPLLFATLALATDPTPAPAKKPFRLAAPALSGLNMTPQQAAYFTDVLAAKLSLNGLQVVTSAEIATLIGVDRQKQLLGCGDESGSCMAELANALGTDGIVTGSIGKFGNAYQVTIKVLAASDGRPLAVYSRRVDGDEELLADLSEAARGLSTEVRRKLTSGAGGEAVMLTGTGSTHPQRKISWVPAAMGVVGVGLGITLLVRSKGLYDRLLTLDPSNSTLDDGRTLRDTGKSFQTWGFVSLAIGAAAFAVAGVLFMRRVDEGPTLAFVPAPGGGVFALGGGLP